MKLFKGIFGDASPALKFIFLIFTTLICSLTFMVLFSAIGIVIYGSEIMDTFTNIGDSTNLNLLRTFQILQSIAIFILPVFIYWHFVTDDNSKFREQNFTKNSSQIYLATVLLLFFAIPIINGMGVWNSSLHLPKFMQAVEQWMVEMEKNAEAITKLFVMVDDVNGLIINIFMIAFLPAVGEELFFRGALQPIFYKWFNNKHLAVWVTAFVFSAIHLQFFGFFPRLFLGALMGYLFLWTNSLAVAMIAHFANNFLGVVGYFLVARGVIKLDMENVGTDSWSALVLSSVVSISIIAYIYKNRVQVSK